MGGVRIDEVHGKGGFRLWGIGPMGRQFYHLLSRWCHRTILNLYLHDKKEGHFEPLNFKLNNSLRKQIIIIIFLLLHNSTDLKSTKINQIEIRKTQTNRQCGLVFILAMRKLK